MKLDNKEQKKTRKCHEQIPTIESRGRRFPKASPTALIYYFVTAVIWGGDGGGEIEAFNQKTEKEEEIFFFLIKMFHFLSIS